MRDNTFWNLRPSTTGRQLIMFPFLGGFGSSYNQLISDLEGDWDIWTANPPGHGPCLLPPAKNLNSLLNHYLGKLAKILKPDAVVFGHSMGSIVAYNVLVAMSQHPRFFYRMPSHLVLSGSCAPHHLPVTGYAELPEADLLLHLCSFGAIPEEVVKDKSIMSMLIPSFRADYKVLEQAKQRPSMKLRVHTSLVFGSRDPQIPEGTPTAWQEYFTFPVRTHVLKDEEHMFILHNTEALNQIINAL